MSDDHLVKKQVLLDYQNMDFIQPSYCISFQKGLAHDIGTKKRNFSLFADHPVTKQAFLD